MSKSVKGNTKKVEEPRATKSKVTKTVEDEMKDATKKSTKGSTATKTTKSVEDTGLGQKRKAAAKTPVVESDVESGANDSETEFMAVSGMSDEEGYDFADVEGGSDNEAEEDDAEETPSKYTPLYGMYCCTSYWESIVCCIASQDCLLLCSYRGSELTSSCNHIRMNYSSPQGRAYQGRTGCQGQA